MNSQGKVGSCIDKPTAIALVKAVKELRLIIDGYDNDIDAYYSTFKEDK